MLQAKLVVIVEGKVGSALGNEASQCSRLKAMALGSRHHPWDRKPKDRESRLT